MLSRYWLEETNVVRKLVGGDLILKRQDIGRGRLMLSGNWLEET